MTPPPGAGNQIILLQGRGEEGWGRSRPDSEIDTTRSASACKAYQLQCVEHPFALEGGGLAGWPCGRWPVRKNI